MKVIVADIIKGSVAAFHEEGLRVYHEVRQALDKVAQIELSFEGIKTCTTQFLNASVGKLYMELGEEKVEQAIHFNLDHVSRLKQKLEDVKWCGLHAKRYQTIVEEAVAC